MLKKLAIVVPYYQRQNGILRKAILSILGQPLPADVLPWIVLVDDASPAPISEELRDIIIPDPFTLTIERALQNGGPGAARNIGIEIAIRGEADYIAFLDSDDTWIGSHLSNALEALGPGCDVYISDHKRTDDYASAFESGAPIFWGSDQVRNARADAAIIGKSCFEIEASFVRSSLIREYVFQTSTVVYKPDRLRDLRFDARLRSAGEDHLFWFDMASAARRFAVSPAVEAECGYGVNIYFGSFSWANPRVVDRHGYRYLLFQEMKARGATTPSERACLSTESANMRNLYGYLLVRHLFRGNLPNWKLFGLVLGSVLRPAAGRSLSSERLRG
jgi:succinoglycan biosynthesis protein ExoW